MTSFSTVRFMRPRRAPAPASLVRLLPVVAAIFLIVPAGVAGKSFGTWGSAMPEAAVNTAAAEGCPD